MNNSGITTCNKVAKFDINEGNKTKQSCQSFRNAKHQYVIVSGMFSVFILT